MSISTVSCFTIRSCLIQQLLWNLDIAEFSKFIYSVEHIKLKIWTFTSKEKLKMKSIIDYPDKLTLNIMC